MTLSCPKCSKPIDGKLLTEEAIVRCPDCGTEIVLTGRVKEGTSGDGDEEGEKVKASGKGAEVEELPSKKAGAPEGPVGSKLEPPLTAKESQEPFGVVICEGCQAEWYGLSGSLCPSCKVPSKVSGKSLEETVKTLLEAVEKGTLLPEKLFSVLMGKEDTFWGGSTEDLRQKIMESGLDESQVGDVAGRLVESMTVKGDRVTVDSMKLEEAIRSVKAGS